MTEQQYRVIADRAVIGDKVDFETWDVGDLLVYQYPGRGNHPGELVRIERPVPPTDEPTVQVSVSLIKQTERALGDAWHPEDCPGSHPAYCTCAVGQARRALRGMVAETTEPVTPPSIADLAPGTTFVDSEGERWTIRQDRDGDPWANSDSGDAWDLDDFAPSTISDVTPPPATPEVPRG